MARFSSQLARFSELQKLDPCLHVCLCPSSYKLSTYNVIYTSAKTRGRSFGIEHAFQKSRFAAYVGVRTQRQPYGTKALNGSVISHLAADEQWSYMKFLGGGP